MLDEFLSFIPKTHIILDLLSTNIRMSQLILMQSDKRQSEIENNLFCAQKARECF